MKHIYHDGGRARAGYTGKAGDCVVRSIAIALELPYLEVYNAINTMAKVERVGRNQTKSTARDGVWRKTYQQYLEERGWKWTPTMAIGTGCKMHLRDGEVPMGRIIARLSRHLCAVVDGTIYDTSDPSRDGTRCVYGYFSKQ